MRDDDPAPKRLTQAERDARRAEKRRAARKGRPAGSTIPLMQDGLRFEVAFWLALTAGFGIAPYPAAYIATGLLTSRRPITVASLDGLVALLSTTHHTPILGHADHLRRKAPEALERASLEERDWLAHSAGTIAHLVLCFATQHWAGVDHAVVTLARSGWHEVLARLAQRLRDATLLNTPIEKPLRRAARALILARQRNENGISGLAAPLFPDRTAGVSRPSFTPHRDEAGAGDVEEREGADRGGKVSDPHERGIAHSARQRPVDPRRRRD